MFDRASLLLRAVAAASTLLAVPSVASAMPTITNVAPAQVVFGETTTITGSVAPVAASEQVQVEQLRDGAWTAVGAPVVTDAAGAWSATFTPATGGRLRATQLTGDLGTSTPRLLTVVPKLLSSRIARGTIYPFLGARATWRVAPATYPDGLVRVKLSIDGRSAGVARARIKDGIVATTLPTKGVGRFRAQLVLPARDGFATATFSPMTFVVRGSAVGSGSSATWNRSLRAALRYRGFHVPGGSSYDSRMGEAVIAFHKAYGRARTTTFERTDWKRLTQKRVLARDRSAGLHVEIDKGRQILMHVKDGRPVMIIHISSGSTGNTPAGRHEIQWKGDWVPSLYGSLLYKSMAFQGAYAIHGYPSVPTTPASHGCVRVPMWIAATLYRRTPVGTPVFVYEGPGSTGTSLGRSGLAQDVPELTGVDAARWADEGPAS